MSNKLKVLLLNKFWAFTLGHYFVKALQRRDDIDLKTTGQFSGAYIPWMGGMRLPEKYVHTPDIPLSLRMEEQEIDYNMVKVHLGDWKPDLIINTSSTCYWKNKPSDGYATAIAIDPHCVSGDTLIATGNGVMYPEEIINSPLPYVCDKNGFTRSDGVVYSGQKKTLTLKFENGMELTCTDDHKVEVAPNDFVEAKDLVVGDTVLAALGTYTPPESRADNDFSVGFIIGAFQGDGSFGSGDMIKFTISKKEKQGFAESIKTHAKLGFDIDTVTEGKHYTSDNAMVLQIRRYGLWRFLKSLDLKGGHLPLIIRTGSREMIGGYLSGLFSADGCSVDGLFQFTTKWNWLAKELQSLMWYIGIYTRIKVQKSGKLSYKPGTKYTTMYVAAGQSTDLFNDLASDIQDKQKRYGTRKRGTDKDNWQNLEITEIVGKSSNAKKHLRVSEFVYDVVNSGSNTFLANGISVHNCLNYDHARSVSDKFFNMQKVYSQAGDEYLPYAFDPTIHYEEDTEKILDVCMVGLEYSWRTQLMDELRKRGLKCHSSTGLVYDEYRNIYSQSHIGLNWSSLDDLNARAFETSMMNVQVMNMVTDMQYFEAFSRVLSFPCVNTVQDKSHFIGAAVEQVMWAMNNLDKAKENNELVRKELAGETYDARIQQIITTCGF